MEGDTDVHVDPDLDLDEQRRKSGVIYQQWLQCIMKLWVF